MSVNMKDVKLPRIQSEWSDEIQAVARAALRSELKQQPKFRSDDLSADVIIEQLWNAIVTASGHDGILERATTLRRFSIGEKV